MFTAINHKSINRIPILFLIFSILYPTQDAHAATTNKSAPWVGSALTGAPCKGPDASFGPYDYRDRLSLTHEIGLVEGAHFNQNVEQLKGGAKIQSHLYGDIDYTLKAFPNHHRALNTVIRYHIRSVGEKNKKLKPAECYLQRAVKFAPDDTLSHMLYGIYLHKIDKFDQALIEYELAEKLSPYNVQLKYNIGLLMSDMKNFDKAKEYAKFVYERKFPLQGLKNSLIKNGYW